VVEHGDRQRDRESLRHADRQPMIIAQLRACPTDDTRSAPLPCVWLTDYVDDIRGTGDPKASNTLWKCFDSVATHDAPALEVPGSCHVIVNEQLQPHLGLAELRSFFIDPEPIRSQFETHCRRTVLCGIQSDEIAIEGDRRLILVWRHFYSDVESGLYLHVTSFRSSADERNGEERGGTQSCAASDVVPECPLA
jgi:hypothetical protein